MNTYENLKKQQKISDMTQPDEIQAILNNATMTKEQKVQAINAYYDALKQSYQKEYDDYVMKQRLGAALEIGSAVIPMGGVGKIGAKIGENLLKKQLGRKISKNIGSGVGSGATAGGMCGAGEGMMQDKNPLTSAMGGVVAGAAAGGAIGAVGANIERAINAEKMRNYGDIDQLPANLRKEYNKFAKKFYQDYLQERNIDLNGNTVFSGKAIQEQLRWNPKQAQNYPNLIKDLKKSKRLPDEPNLKPAQKPNVSHYEVYQGENGIYHVEVSKGGKRRFYISNDTTDIGVPERGARSTNPSPLGNNYSVSQEGNIVNLQTGYITNKTPERATHAASTDTYKDNAILPQNAENVNPVQTDVSASMPLLTPILDGRVEMSVDESGSPLVYIPKTERTPIGDLIKEYEKNMDNFMAEYTPKPKHIFTAEEIGKMKLEDFRKNEEEIMRQYKEGMILPRGEKRIDYSDYVNPIIQGLKKIFTREEIQTMKPEEYKMYENAINAQAEKIGVPSEIQMNGASKRGDGVIYVRPYIRRDGTQVRGYWRSVN